jgi:hypothetical protein
VLSGLTGLFLAPDYSVATWGGDIYRGFEGMLEIMVLSMFIGGLSAIMKREGGLDWVRDRIQRIAGAIGKTGKRTGEAAIAALVSVTNLFVANNTVARQLSDQGHNRKVALLRLRQLSDVLNHGIVIFADKPFNKGLRHCFAPELTGPNSLLFRSQRGEIGLSHFKYSA